MHPASHRRSRTLPVLNVVVATAVLLAACSSGQEALDKPKLDPPGKPSAQLMAALEKIPDVRRAAFSAEVKFGDTEALRDLFGKDWYSGDSAFSGFQGYGSLPLNAAGEQREELTAIDPRDGEFIASIYNPTDSQTKSWTTVTGGQDTEAIRDAFLELGWEETDSGLEADTDTTGSDADTDDQSQDLSAEFLEVQLDGSTVEFGSLDSFEDSASGVLADDPRFVDLAGCLGEVMAAVLIPADVDGDSLPGAYAVGLRTATSLEGTPQIVGCSSWQDADQADNFVIKATNAFISGSDGVGQPFQEIYPHPTVQRLDGKYPLVQITTDTTETPYTLLEALPQVLPGF